MLKHNYGAWVPEGYGTSDVIIISDGVLDVIDLKYGVKVPVEAINNPQIRLYALGAIEEYSYLYDIAEVHMTIVQPRLDKISTEIMTVSDLLAWAETDVKPIAELAFNGEGAFKCGDWCRWCRVKGNCRTRADENLKALEYAFTDPALLSDEEIGSILPIVDRIKAWAVDVKDYAEDRAIHGHPIPQHKLVEGKPPA